MATEIAVPFGVDNSGGIAVLTDANSLAQQHVRAVIGTIPGERVMRLTFGLPVRDYLFESNTSAERAELLDRVNTALQTFVPDVSLRSVDVHLPTTGDPSTMICEVTYDVRSSNPASISQTVEAVVSST